MIAVGISQVRIQRAAAERRNVNSRGRQPTVSRKCVVGAAARRNNASDHCCAANAAWVAPTPYRGLSPHGYSHDAALRLPF